MATRENQSLQVALMVFALLVVLLAVATYVGFSQSSERGKQLADTNQRLSEANAGVRKTQGEANRYKEMMGFQTDDELSTIEEAFLTPPAEEGSPGTGGDMQKYAANLPEEEQVYRGALERLFNELQTVKKREVESLRRGKSLELQLDQVQTDASNQVNAYKQKMDDLAKDAESESEKFEEERRRFVKELAGINTQLESLRKEKGELATNADAERSQFEDQIGKLQRQLFRVSREKEELVKGSFEVADGKVARVSQGSGTAWVNLGWKDGLHPRVMFSVYDPEENNATSAPRKGALEIVRVLSDHLAEARILSDTASNPIVSGDQIYSPIWHRGRSESFALAGVIDVDGDGTNDKDRVRNLIQVNGGQIDAEIGDDGAMTGTLTVNTRYLVLGDEPNLNASITQDATSIKKGLDAYSEMNRQAENLGVEKISVHEFLDRMGWRPEDRTLAVGRGARSIDFPPRPGPATIDKSLRGPDGRFRRRHPPRVSY